MHIAKKAGRHTRKAIMLQIRKQECIQAKCMMASKRASEM